MTVVTVVTVLTIVTVMMVDTGDIVGYSWLILADLFISVNLVLDRLILVDVGCCMTASGAAAN